MKKILTVISIFIIFIFAFFIFEKIFPSEVYAIKSIFSSNHKNNFPVSESYYEDYLIFRGKADSLLTPKGFSDLTISPDNAGYYIITGKR